jgi:hypothetical protein
MNMDGTTGSKTHERKIKVDKTTRDTRIKRIEAKRGDEIAFIAENGGIWVIIPDTDLELLEEPPPAEKIESDLWFAFRLDSGGAAVVRVPEDYPVFYPDPEGEPRIVGTKEVYYFVICGDPPGAYPATGNSPPRMIIPPSPVG